MLGWCVIPPNMWLLSAATYSSSSLDLTLEIFCKCRLRQKIFPLASQREFVLLYNGVYPPESVLTCTRNNTSRDFNQRSTKKTKTTEQRRYKLGSEGKFVPSASSDSTVNVGKERDASKSSCLSTSTWTIPHTLVRIRTPGLRSKQSSANVLCIIM